MYIIDRLLKTTTLVDKSFLTRINVVRLCNQTKFYNQSVAECFTPTINRKINTESEKCDMLIVTYILAVILRIEITYICANVHQKLNFSWEQ